MWGKRRSQLQLVAMNIAAVASFLTLCGVAKAQPLPTFPHAPSSSAGDELRVDAVGDTLPDYALARLGTNRFRHPGHISDIALSHDESFVITVGTGNTVNFWSLPGGELLRTFEGPAHWRGIDLVAISPNNKLVAVATFAKGDDVAVFDRETGKELWRDNAADKFPPRIDNDLAYKGSLSFSFDGDLVVLACESQVFYWRAANGAEKRVRQGYPVLAYDPVSNSIFSFEKDGRDIWKESITNGTSKKAWPPPKEEMFPGGITISSNGRWALHVRFRRLTPENREQRRFAFVINLNNGSVAHTWEYGDQQWATHRFIGTQPFLVRGIAGNYEFYDLSRESPFDAPVFVLPYPRFTNLRAIAPKRKLLIGTDANVVMPFDLSKREMFPSLSHPDFIHNAWFSPDGQWIATERAGEFRVWHARTGKQAWEKRDRSATFFGFSSDSSNAVLAGKDALYWHDPQSGELKNTVLLDKVLPRVETERGPFAYSSRKEVYACVDGDRLMLVDAKTGKQCSEGNWNRNELKHAQFSPSGNYLLTVAEDGNRNVTILLWDVRRLEAPKQVHCPGASVISTAFDARDGYVALIVQDKHTRSRRVLHIVELATGEVVRKRLPGDESSTYLHSVGFLDSNTLALAFYELHAGTGYYKSGSVLIESVNGENQRPWEIPRFRFLDPSSGLLLTNDVINGKVPEVVSFSNVDSLKKEVPVDLAESQLASLWDQLAKDPVTAEDAVGRLRAVESQKLAVFLQSRLAPVSVLDQVAIRRAVAEIAAVDPDAVENARRRVMTMGVQALPVIRRVLQEGVDSSTERLLRETLRAISVQAWTDSEEVRALRALRALSGNRSREVIQLLTNIATGGTEAKRTLQAKEQLRLLAAPARSQ